MRVWVAITGPVGAMVFEERLRFTAPCRAWCAIVWMALLNSIIISVTLSLVLSGPITIPAVVLLALSSGGLLVVGYESILIIRKQLSCASDHASWNRQPGILRTKGSYRTKYD